MGRRRLPGAFLRLAALAAGLILLRAVADLGGPVRLASLLLHRLPRRRRRPALEPDESRLYARRRRRLEAHLTRFPDGRVGVLALPLDGGARASTYVVDPDRPWRDFERQAGLLGAPWGPCRAANAGL